mmetsp:Transcript_23781/g.30943  ORF Transcript_23781/g.30943 Transcript_23781/m.30943 type:complete len:185 (-) Transcript_23781:58-612(-)
MKGGASWYIVLLYMELAAAQGMQNTGFLSPIMSPTATETKATPLIHEQLRGKKILPGSGDAVDFGSSAALGIVTGASLKFALNFASGLAYNIAFSATVVAVGAWAGLISVKWRRIKEIASRILPDAILPTVESISSRFNLNSKDGFMSKEEIEQMKHELRSLAEQNLHATLGGCIGLLLSFLFI